MLAKSVARTLDCSFRRIQFTPDLLPSDVTGVSFFNQRTQEFEFRPGPIFAQVVLADEINRATPRTQSALLECMEERQVSLEGETRPLPRPFLVLATQNPIELEGTFPLPEAQLDRFLLRLSIGYPERSGRKGHRAALPVGSPLDELPAVVDAGRAAGRCSGWRARCTSPSAVEDYIVRLVRASRLHASIELGASPRATLALYHAAQALAGDQRAARYVLPDDVKRLAPAVLTHRLITSAQSRLRGRGRRRRRWPKSWRQCPVPVEDAMSPTASHAGRGSARPLRGEAVGCI